MDGEFHDEGIQFWHTIWMFLKKEANDLDIFHISPEPFSLEERTRWFAL